MTRLARGDSMRETTRKLLRVGAVGVWLTGVLLGFTFGCGSGGGGEPAEDVRDDAAPPTDSNGGVDIITIVCTSDAECAGAFPNATPCQVATCHAGVQCVLEDLADGTPCDDGDACTQASACAGGVCEGSAELDCEDGNVCTADSCDATTGCVHTANVGAPCDDGDACTTDDVCGADGLCAGTNECQSCEGDADCVAFEDGDRCNGTLHCVDSLCQVDPLTIVTCAPADEPCRENRCLPETGACELAVLADGSACDDDDACTTGDTCQAGECAGAARDCDDQNACTADSCDAATGECLNTARDCDDQNACTADSCDAATGECLNTARDCDDQNACTTDSCDAATGECLNTARDCDDQNLCTADSCDPATGQCVNAARACDDQNLCTADSCDAATGECVNTARDCDDQNLCTADSCDAATGECVNAARDCDDQNACTADSCDAATGECVNAARDCDDLVPCTIDSCDPLTGECVNDDSACVGTETECTDEIDNDEDGDTDCADDDCAADPACAPCVDDDGEDDDTIATATPLPANSVVTDRVAAHGDLDVYAIDVCAGGTIAILASFVHLAGDIDLYLLDGTGEEIAWSITEDDDELIEGTVLVDTTLYVMVEMYSEGGCNTYDLSFVLDDSRCGATVEDCGDSVDNDLDGDTDCDDADCADAPECQPCEPDFYEPNDTRAEAETLTLGADLAATLCDGDTDWFTFAADAECRVQVAISFERARGELDVILRDETDAVVATAEPAAGGKALVATAAGGTYALVVSRASGTVEAYTLNAVVVCPAPEVCNDRVDNDLDGATDCDDLEDCGDYLPCLDDEYEDNDTLATAVAGPFAASLVSVSGDEDWFAYEVCPLGTIAVDLLFIDDDGDIDLYLRSAADTSLAASVSTTDNESLRWTNGTTAAVPVFARIRNYTANVATPYDLAVRIDCPELCDDSQDNDGDGAVDCGDEDCVGDDACDPLPAPEFAQIQWPLDPVVVPIGGDVPLIFGRVYVPGLTPGEGRGFGVRGQLGYGPDGTEPASASGWTWVEGAYNGEQGNDDEFVVALENVGGGLYDFAWRFTTDNGATWIYADLPPGTVDGYSVESAGSLYVLAPENCTNDFDDDGDEDVDCDDADCADVPACLPCADAAFEPDSFLAPTVVTLPTTQNRVICPAGESDWFTFTLATAQTVLIETSGPSGDSRMWLFDESGTLIEYDDDDGVGSFSLIQRQLAAGTYVVEVDEFGDDNELTYQFAVRVVDAYCGDVYEPDSRQAPTPLVSGIAQSRAICPVADIDYFTFTLTGEADVVLEASGPSGDGEMRLFDAAWVLVEYDDDDGPGLFPRIERRLGAGTYHVEVNEYGNNATINAYTMTYTATPTFTCIDDDLEDNDDFATATIYEGGGPITAVAAEGDDDYYVLLVCAGASLTVTATFDAATNLDLVVFDELGVEVGRSATAAGTETVTYVSEAEQLVFVRVEEQAAAACAAYELDFDVDSSGCPANPFFSQYLEGSSNNKALEIVNGPLDGLTGNLSRSTCVVKLYANGATTSSQVTLTAGTLAPGETWVLCHNLFALGTPAALCDQLWTGLTFNGDDTLELVCDGVTYDVFGQIGFRPATSWNVNGVQTIDRTLTRKCEVTTGDPIGSDVFDPSVQWTSSAAIDDITGLGEWSCP
jgi:hypothetical protein